MTVKTNSFDDVEFLSQAGKGRANLKSAPGSHIYSQGDAATSVYYLRKGMAKKSVTSPAGKDAVLSIVEPGDFFGEGGLHRPLSRRIVTVTAITECSLVRIEYAAMARGLRENADFSYLFMTFLIKRNRRVVDDLVSQIFNSSEMRLARTLLLLGNLQKAEIPDAMRKMSQETLAEMVGTTRSRISFFMNKFRRLGLIDYRGNGLDLRINAPLLDKLLHDGACMELVSNIESAAPSRHSKGRLTAESADRRL